MVTKGLMPTLETMNPLKRPMAVPSPSPTSTARATGASEASRSAVQEPVKATTEPTDMSKPPDTMRFVIATAMMASTDRPSRSASRFPEERK